MENKDWEKMKDHEKAEFLENKAYAIQEGIAPRVKSLCGTCLHATVYRRRGYVHEVIWCNTLDREMPDDIDECSSYRSPHALTMDQMVSMALAIDARPDGRGGNYL